MRTQFVLGTHTAGQRDAKEACPWAARIVPVDGGYMCFESEDDYRTWKNQK